MAEKLSESSWTGFAKKRELDDAALVKALAKFDKTDEKKPEPRLDALQEVEAQIARQVVAIARRKKELGDKPWKEAKDKLDAMLAETGRLIKETRAAVAAAAEKADDEEDSPALLTTGMVPLLRALKKPDVQMHALVATAGRNTAVLVMRRPIGASRRKLLADAVDAKSGIKYIVGECRQEKGALTFVVQSPAAGLAKRIRAALLEQTSLRLKVRVRGDDGEDEDGEEEAEAEAEAVTAQSATRPATAVAPAILYTQTRLAWVATRAKVQKELARLETAILDAYRGRAALPEVTQKVRKLDGVLAMFDESLTDSLDGALNAVQAEDKQRFHAEARATIARYQRFLASDPLLQELDGNPFAPVAVRATLSASLATLSAKIV